jgi:hypothetical protein
VLLSIETHLSASTLTTMAGGLTAPPGSLTIPVAEASGLPARPTRGPLTRFGSLTTPLGGPTAHVVELGGQTAPPCSTTTCVVEADVELGGQTAPPGSTTACVVEADSSATTLMAHTDDSYFDF